MGRGRAKAKQTKVARRLKYQSIDTDFSALERELSGGQDGDESDDTSEYDVDHADYSEYVDYADDDEPRRRAG